MLKEIFNKEEKSEEEKTKEINQKTLIYLIIFVVGISFLFINTNEKGNGNNTKPNNENTITITKEDIVKKFDNIKDNYSLDITEKVNDEIVKLKIDTDGKLTAINIQAKGGYFRRIKVNTGEFRDIIVKDGIIIEDGDLHYF